MLEEDKIRRLPEHLRNKKFVHLSSKDLRIIVNNGLSDYQVNYLIKGYERNYHEMFREIFIKHCI